MAALAKTPLLVARHEHSARSTSVFVRPQLCTSSHCKDLAGRMWGVRAGVVPVEWDERRDGLALHPVTRAVGRVVARGVRPGRGAGRLHLGRADNRGLRWMVGVSRKRICDDGENAKSEKMTPAQDPKQAKTSKI